MTQLLHACMVDSTPQIIKVCVGFLVAASSLIYKACSPPHIFPFTFFCAVAIADMKFFRVANAASLLALAGFGCAQFPPTPEGVTVLDSKFGDGVKLSWKEVCLS